MTFTIEMVDPQRVILEEIANKKFTRNSVALTYAFCLRQREEVDFGIVNRAILERWSRSGLEYIKKKAWNLVEGKECA